MSEVRVRHKVHGWTGVAESYYPGLRSAVVRWDHGPKYWASVANLVFRAPARTAPFTTDQKAQLGLYIPFGEWLSWIEAKGKDPLASECN